MSSVDDISASSLDRITMQLTKLQHLYSSFRHCRFQLVKALPTSVLFGLPVLFSCSNPRVLRSVGYHILSILNLPLLILKLFSCIKPLTLFYGNGRNLSWQARTWPSKNKTVWSSFAKACSANSYFSGWPKRQYRLRSPIHTITLRLSSVMKTLKHSSDPIRGAFNIWEDGGWSGWMVIVVFK